MIGPKGLERVVNALRVIAPELPFPIEFIELTDPKEEITIAGYRIQAYRVNHNIVCYGYSLSIDRAGRFSVEEANRHQIPQKYWSRLQKERSSKTENRPIRRKWCLDLPEKGSKLLIVRIPDRLWK